MRKPKGRKRIGFEIRGEQFGKMMTSESQNIERAKDIVNQMQLTDGEKARLKKAIENYDDPFEQGYVARFYYDGKHNRELTIQIQELLRKRG